MIDLTINSSNSELKIQRKEAIYLPEYQTTLFSRFHQQYPTRPFQVMSTPLADTRRSGFDRCLLPLNGNYGGRAQKQRKRCF